MKLGTFALYTLAGFFILGAAEKIYDIVCDKLYYARDVFISQLLQKAYPDYTIYSTDIKEFLILFKLSRSRDFNIELDLKKISPEDVKEIYTPDPAHKRQPK